MKVNIINSDKKTLEFEIEGVDSIIAKLLSDKLNEDKDVEFAAYKIPHPLIRSPRVMVKTKRKDAADLVVEKLEELKEEVANFRKEFKDAMK